MENECWLNSIICELKGKDEISRAYENTITRFALSEKMSERLGYLNAYLADESCDSYNAYVVYCLLHTYYRRIKDYDKLETLSKKYGERFKDRAIALHYELMAYVDEGKRVDMDILNEAKRSAGNLPDNPGPAHLYAILVAQYCELHSNSKNTFEDLISEGLIAVNTAINLEKHARFYCTRARLQCLQGYYDLAQNDISLAIRLEKTNEQDYALRISEYLNYRMRIESVEKHELLGNEIERQINISNQSTIRNIEFLSLFAAIVGFLFGGVNIVSNSAEFSFLGAAGLLVLLIGGLLVLFWGTSYILLRSEKEEKNISILILKIGLALMIFGFLTCWLSSSQLSLVINI